jgi:hypothetical protein
MWYNRNMTQNEEARSHADDTYARMRSLIDTMASVPGEFSLEELAGLAVSMADHDALVRMAMDMLLHKGRQHCGGKIRRPDGEEGVMSDGGRGRYPRAVPVDRRGTSTWVGWAYSDEAQRFDAAHRRAAQANGLGIEAQRITAAIEAQRQAQRVATVLDYTDGVAVVQIGDSVILGVDPARSYNIDDPDSSQVHASPNYNLPEKVWEGGGWLAEVVRAGS